MSSSKLQIVFLILFCIIVANSFSVSKNLIEQTSTQVEVDENLSKKEDQLKNLKVKVEKGKLGLTNITGSLVSSTMANNFQSYITTSYIVYKDDLYSSANYIASSLETILGYKFTVAIHKDSDAWQDYLLYSLQGQTYAIWYCPITTKGKYWVYIIAAYAKVSTMTGDYVYYEGIGSGINYNTMVKINSIITAQQSRYSDCYCDADQLSDNIQAYDRQKWSVFCKKWSLNIFNSFVQSTNHQYMYTSVDAAKCQYVFYAL